MAFLSLEDLQGVVEIVVFADTYRDCQNLLKSDKPLLVKGKIAGDERGAKIIASEILGLSQALEKSVAALDVRLSLVGLTPEKIIGLKNIVEGHKGHCPLFLHFNLPGKGEVTISLPSALKVAPSAGFIKEIEAFLGYPAVQNSHINGASR